MKALQPVVVAAALATWCSTGAAGSDCIRAQSACATNSWPDLYGRVGADDIDTPDDVDAAAKIGIQIDMHAGFTQGSDLAIAMRRVGMRYIDTTVQRMLYKSCGRRAPADACTSDSERALLGRISAYVRIAVTNDRLAGFWILDDYPGRNIRGLLTKIHDIIAKARPTRRVPTICGFGGRIDRKTTRSDPEFAISTHPFDLALTNFAPNTCDSIALYPYASARTNDPRLIDWSMTRILPYMLSALRERGWEPKREPLIGIVQTFSYPGSPRHYVSPRQQDVKTQAAAFCKVGAIAVIAYTWNDSYNGQKIELFNSPGLRKGLQLGARSCDWSIGRN